MKTVLKAWLQLATRSRRLFLVLSGSLISIFFVDFFIRVFVPRDGDLRKFSAPEVRSLPSGMRLEVIRARLEVALPAPPTTEELAAKRPRDIGLQGIFISRGSRVAALVLLPQGDKPIERRNVAMGGEIDGWTVERVEVSKVALRKGTETKELVMFKVR